VPVTVTDGGLEFGVEQLEFPIDILGGRITTHQWDVSDDGSVLVFQVDDSSPREASTPLELVMGWREGVAGR
jgi:hypothetical protein